MVQLGVSWIYKLKKEELTQELVNFKIEKTGTVPDLKKRSIEFIRKNPLWFTNKPRDVENYTEDADRTLDEEEHVKELIYVMKPENTSSPLQNATSNEQTQIAASTSRNQSSIFVMPESNSNSKILDQMRK